MGVKKYEDNEFYSHVNYSVTKIKVSPKNSWQKFYSHVNYSVTKMIVLLSLILMGFTVT